MNELKTDKGEWRAFLDDSYGWIPKDPADVDELLGAEGAGARISIRRGSALPGADGGDPDRLPGTTAPGDIFMELDLEDIDPATAPEVWELAQRAVWGMSQDPAFIGRTVAASTADIDGGADYGDRAVITELRVAARHLRSGVAVDQAQLAGWLECVAIDEKTEHESAPRFRERYNALLFARAVNAAVQAPVEAVAADEH